MAFWDRFPVYVPVAQRQARAAKEVARLLKKEGRDAHPVTATRRAIAETFWGRNWCENLERYSDYASRLPRGRTYLRNGSVMDLFIDAGRVRALVAGTELYRVEIKLRKLAAARWKRLIAECTGRVSTMIALLRGELSPDVLAVISARETGLFPAPDEIELDCSCPDGAVMCKHVAATLYGVGVRLDQRPELFFLLRQVDQQDLVNAESAVTKRRSAARGPARRLEGTDLGELFGIELAKPRRRKS